MDILGFGTSKADDGYTWAMILRWDSPDDFICNLDNPEDFELENVAYWINAVLWQGWGKACGIPFNVPENYGIDNGVLLGGCQPEIALDAIIDESPIE